MQPKPLLLALMLFAGSLTYAQFAGGYPQFYSIHAYGRTADNRLDTVGSRFLLDKWATGVIIKQDGSQINDTTMLLNYDKETGKLSITKDMQRFFLVGTDEVKTFTLQTKQRGYMFCSVPEIKDNAFFQLMAKGDTCTVYKRTFTEIKKPTYQSTGLTESGNKYYEFSDNNRYYILDVAGRDKFSGEFALSKSGLQKIFSFQQEKLSQYLSQHKRDEVNDEYLIGLANYINE